VEPGRLGGFESTSGASPEFARFIAKVYHHEILGKLNRKAS
jgi:hypothetical protein